MRTILTETVAKLLFFPVLIVGIALWVKGYGGVGDGFSAGVVAGLGFLLQYLVLGYGQTKDILPIRIALGTAVSGLLLALVVGLFPMLAGRRVLTHFPKPGTEVVHFGQFEFHTAVVLDLGIFMLVFGFVVFSIRVMIWFREEQE